MSTPSVPKALYQANIDLALRIAALLQEHGQQWYDLFADEAGVRLGQGLAGVDRFRRDFSLDALPPLPVDFAGHFDALDAERWQALLAKAIDHQSRFSVGVQAALEDWQGACTQLLGEALPKGALPDLSQLIESVPGLGEILSSLQQLGARGGRVAAAPAAPKPAKPLSEKPAAAGKVGTAKAPAKPAAKTVAKTPAKAAKAPTKAAKAPTKAAKAPTKAAKAPTRTVAKGGPAKFPSPIPALVTTPRQRKKS
ncbi:MAG TPA: hypothetical protein PLI44_06225 [Chiayiivirga sp.]|jgi:hypothetical protein|uniref:Uncharacterized protein n=1 Tax=Denitratimonas tolerans TaxID=1338420 RepID=A0AAW9RAF9_9GAMM|nr:hypothetical protein [Xanthomonadaceae bacterium]MDX9765489.1 hypothetical protein [Chiayiivirga sp.]MEB2316380.1 hypothetical protein [Xanthomonadaceae bacterium]HRN59816.1 hypothetical protein [Chiayiivirga sp.]